LKYQKQFNVDDAIIIALGSSLAGDYRTRQALLEAATNAFPTFGMQVRKLSRWWSSRAWPDPMRPPYLNGVALVETGLDPGETLAALLRIERQFGRERSVPNAPRTLDLDLIAHGGQVLHTPDLTVPHPRAHERRFVMGPLAEIAPEWRHPVLGETAAALAARATVGADAEPVA
jgi:2-amino-4-hydroxy-6-hydroxymethyldihydropteridine diphosphokinase